MGCCFIYITGTAWSQPASDCCDSQTAQIIRDYSMLANQPDAEEPRLPLACILNTTGMARLIRHMVRCCYMNEKQDNHQNAFVEVGRFLGGSRIGRFIVSVAIAALFFGLAYTAWHARDLTAIVLSVGLIVYGLQVAWRVLPISSTTRTRWVREQQIVEKCPASNYRLFLWVGLCNGVLDLWRADFTKPIDYYIFIFPGIFIAIGTVSYICCHRFLRSEGKSKPSEWL
jgi:hypothetical protein